MRGACYSTLKRLLVSEALSDDEHYGLTFSAQEVEREVEEPRRKCDELEGSNERQWLAIKTDRNGQTYRDKHTGLANPESESKRQQSRQWRDLDTRVEAKLTQ